jgi:hypothetical protein
MENHPDSPSRRGCKHVLAKLAFFGRPSSGGGCGPSEFPLAFLDHGEDFSRKKTLARGSSADKILHRGPGRFFDFDADRGVCRSFSLRDFFPGFGYFVRRDPAGFPDLKHDDPANIDGEMTKIADLVKGRQKMVL